MEASSPPKRYPRDPIPSTRTMIRAAKIHGISEYYGLAYKVLQVYCICKVNHEWKLNGIRITEKKAKEVLAEDRKELEKIRVDKQPLRA